MARPLKPIGTHGKVWVTAKPSGGWLARTKYRDPDGIVRLVERTGRTSSAARNALLAAVQKRSGTGGDEVTDQTRFDRAAELWMAEVQAAGNRGDLSPSTVDLYERQLRNHILRALGALRLREVTTPRVSAFLADLRGRLAVATVRTCRSVISGVMRYAVTHGAVLTNPTREIQIPKERRRPPRALNADERDQWLAMLAADPVAVRKDLPDLTRWMLATGVRIGEALAVSWNEIDLDTGTVAIEWNLIRIRGEGLRRVPRVKTDSGERTLPLPDFALDMLHRRAQTHTTGPLFPDSVGGWRDPSNTRRDLRTARGTQGFAWVTSHVFRKTCATILDDAGRSARAIADQLGHSRPSITQDIYLGRKTLDRANARALDNALDTKSTQ